LFLAPVSLLAVAKILDLHSALPDYHSRAGQVVAPSAQAQSKFQGEQSADPSFSSDCRIGDGGTVLPPKNVDVTAAEFQVFSSPATVPSSK
jgi:hypothetical protein